MQRNGFLIPSLLLRPHHQNKESAAFLHLLSRQEEEARANQILSFFISLREKRPPTLKINTFQPG